MKMKTLLFLLVLTCLAATEARADDITITFDNPNQTGSPGDILQFFVTITNNTADPIFLNNESLNLESSSFTEDDQELFFADVPISLDAGASSGEIDLFDVTLLNPFTDPLGLYSGTYTMLGGADGNAQDVLTEADFSVTATASTTTVPEPATLALLCIGLAGMTGISFAQRVAHSRRL